MVYRAWEAVVIAWRQGTVAWTVWGVEETELSGEG